MQRKTIVIEFVMEDDKNQKEKRKELNDALQDLDGRLYKGLKDLGWSGNQQALSGRVSNSKRTDAWPI